MAGTFLEEARRIGRARWAAVLVVVVSACLVARADDPSPEPQPAEQWPSFRGEFARGVSDAEGLPEQWALETGAGVRWKTPVPGLGHSSPVIWNERLFLTTAASEAEAELTIRKGPEHARRAYGWIKPLAEEGSVEQRVICIDKNDGRVIWARTAHVGIPLSQRHSAGTHANPSAAVDERHVVAYFGAEGLYCFDHDGALLWERDLGALVGGYYVNPDIQWGVASSPVLHAGRVIVLCDVLVDPFLAAFDAETGDELWKTARIDVPTWGTPTIHVGDQRTQILVNGYESSGGYDFETGAEAWTMKSSGAVPIPTVVAAHGLFFFTSAGGVPGGRGAAAMRSPILAIRAADANGVVTVDNHVEWYKARGGNYMPSPLVYRDELYCATDSILTCYDAHTGKEHYRQRLGSAATTFAASPVAGDGKVYLTKDDGTVHVLRAGPDFEVLAVNPLDEVCMATPAISGGALFFRTRGHLLAVGD